MKNLLSLLYLIFSIGISNVSFSQSPQDSILGKWHLISSSGGVTGKGFPIKKKTIVEFTLDYTYKLYEQDSLKYIHPYSFIKSTSKHLRTDSTAILQIGNSPFRKYKFFFRKNKLLLREPYPDGFTRVYMRISSSYSTKY